MANANNTVVLIGWIVNNPTFISRRDGVEFSARFTLKVDKNYRDKEGKRGADFIPVHLDGVNRMEFAHMLKEKQAVVVCGSLATESYTDAQGRKVYSMYLAADNVTWTYGNTVSNQPVEQQAAVSKKEEPIHTDTGKKMEQKEEELGFDFDIGMLPFR